MSTGWSAPLDPRPHHDVLCGAIVALAQSAGARLAARDAADGFLSLPGAQRANLAAQGNRFGELCARVVDAWQAAASAPTGVTVGLLGAIAARPEERILVALLAAVELERGIGKALRFCAPDGVLTAGALLDLMSTSISNRMLLAGLLHSDAVLRRTGLVLAEGDGAISVRSVISLAPAVVGALRGEPAAAPAASDSIGYRPEPAATELLDRIGVRGARSGAVTVVAGPRVVAVPLTHLLLLARNQVAWMLPSAPAVSGLGTDLAQWRRWALHAVLAGRVLVVDIEGAPLDAVTVLAREVAVVSGAAILVLTSAAVAGVDGEQLSVIPCVEVAAAAVQAAPAAGGILGAMVGALRAAS